MPQEPEVEVPHSCSTKESAFCHIHDNVLDRDASDIRTFVCVKDLPLTWHTDGKYYCLFHLPSQDKNTVQFGELLGNRLESVKRIIGEPAGEDVYQSGQSRASIRYDFRFVYFPSSVNFVSVKFEAPVDFSSAFFVDYADFRWAVFTADVYFNSVTFSSKALFNSATFSSNAIFRSAAFSKGAYFRSTAFSGFAEFDSAAFSSYAYFGSAIFSAPTYFSSAKFALDVEFGGVTFSRVIFAHTEFSGQAKFSATRFLSGAYFDETQFKVDVNFNFAVLGPESDVLFRRALFSKEADFRFVASEGYVRFSYLILSQHSRLDLQEAAFEKASRVSFHTSRLHPSWFLNVDARKFVFTNITWENLGSSPKHANVTRELEMIEEGDEGEELRLLEIACRQLAVNAEENNRYEEAAKFRFMAMETRRLQYRWKGRFWTLNWWYRFSSGYGESWIRALAVLAILLVVFGLLYFSPLARFEVGASPPIPGQAANVVQTRRMTLSEGLVHSVYVSALQRPEPKAADTRTKLLVILETILGPLQAALLALAIRRKFMR